MENREAPLVTAIIIFYNAERFLEEAITNVFRQTYAAWELLLVDDGSTDGSSQLARRLAQQHPERVRYLEHAGHENRGMSATRNRGLREARGRYVAFLDADDVWLPGKLAEQVAILEREAEAAMVYGQSQYWYSWTGRPDDRRRDYLPGLGVQPDALHPPPVLCTRALAGQLVTPCPSDMMLRREAIERVGGFEEHFRGIYQHCEDQAFLSKVFLREAVYVTDASLTRYRIHPHSCSAQTEDQALRHTVWLYYLTWLDAYMRSEGIRDVGVWRALRNEMRPYRHPRLQRLLDAPLDLAGYMKRVAKQHLLS